MFDARKAKAYIRSADLPEAPPPRVGAATTAPAGNAFEAGKDQALVVGSGVLSFAHGVDAAARAAITDCVLLAQLVASKRAAADQDPLAWFAAYAQVLQNLGWAIGESGWTGDTAKGTAVEVHKKILEVMAVALGPSAAAVAVLKATMGALAGMQPDSPWLTIFNRESKAAKIARFQVGLVEPGSDGALAIALLACLLEAETGITQVLFFKLEKNLARFRSNSAKASIEPGTLRELGPLVRDKVRAFQADFLSGIKDL